MLSRGRAAVLVAVLVLAGCSSSGGSTTVAASTTQVSFDANGSTTYATLDIPAHHRGQRLAAALLIPGSGPTDRDGNDANLGVTAATLRLVADVLAQRGVMSLRYDKYFTGRTGAGRYAADPGAVTMTEFVQQAGAAYSYLAARSDADPAKLLVVGHSEGGLVALAVAVAARNKPAGLALLEPQDQRILDLIRLQTDEAIAALVRQGALTTAQARTNVTLVAQAIADFRARRTVRTAGIYSQVVQTLSGLILNPDNAAFVRSDDAIVPVTLAARVNRGTRVLVTEGTRDTNVPPRTAQPLVAALTAAGTTGPGLRLLQGTDHFLHLPNQPDTDAVLAPEAITTLSGWAQPFAPS